MKKKKRTPQKPDDKFDKKQGLRNRVEYGDKVSICINSECVMRKKARCFGFEGCPGFKSK